MSPEARQALETLGAATPEPLRLPGALESCLEGLAGLGFLGTLPQSPPAPEAVLADPAHLAALRQRLHLLGYLDDADADTATLAQAVREFQFEADLVVDGWVGARTWAALQELFTFEDPLDAARWFDPGEKPRAALVRAVRLRLRAYGQWDSATGAPPTLEEALARWMGRLQDAAWSLADAVGEDAPLELSPQRVQRLFDHDGLVTHLAAHPGLCAPESHGAQGGVWRHFLLCLAKVELWLHGYPVSPDGDSRLTVRGFAATGGGGRRGRAVVQDSKSDFLRVLERFLRDTEEAPEALPALRLAGVPPPLANVDGRIDQRLAEVIQRSHALRARGGSPGRAAAAVDDAQLAAIIQAQPDPEGFWNRLSETLRGLAGSLFDGLGRAWSWLRRQVDAAVSWLHDAVRWSTETLVNFGRLVWGRLSEVGRLLRLAFGALIEGVGFLCRPEVPGLAPGHLAMAHDADLDFRVWVAPAPSPAALALGLRALERQTCAFGVSCKLVGVAVSACAIALRGAAAGSGVGLWLVAASLVRLLRELRVLGGELERYAAYVEEAPPPARRPGQPGP